MTDVPCNGCKACCKGQRIILGAKDLSDFHYEKVPTRKGNDGAIEFMLAHKQNGDCWYLTDAGCSIHEYAPQACRDFDCRIWFLGFSERMRLQVEASPLDGECAASAKRLLTGRMSP